MRRMITDKQINLVDWLVQNTQVRGDNEILVKADVTTSGMFNPAGFAIGDYENEAAITIQPDVDNEVSYIWAWNGGFELSDSQEGTGISYTPDHGLELFSETNVFIYGLPTSDPGVAGALWNDNGVLKISAGE